MLFDGAPESRRASSVSNGSLVNDNDGLNRRTLLKLAGLTAAQTALSSAGCGSGDSALPRVSSSADGAGTAVAPAWLGTARIGQISGSTNNDSWKYLVDAQQRPLLNDTGLWDVVGVDLGANTEHGNRTYIFFGDVAIHDSSDKLRDNGDLIAWTDDESIVRHGGHQTHLEPLKFVIPILGGPVQGQVWRFCVHCATMFWEDGGGSVCPKSKNGHAAAGERFVLPYNDTPVQGQREWRFCGQCHALFYAPDGQPNGKCPAGPAPNSHHAPAGWNFVLPSEGSDQGGQHDWRYCLRCAGLFWDGGANKGVCPGAEGGGVHLHPVLTKGSTKFEPFTAEAPIGTTLSLETPGGAFSFNNRVYVFVNISDERYSNHVRPGNPVFGTYLTSTDTPDEPKPFQKEFLFSPRMGYCPRDAGRGGFESHRAMGFDFVLPHSIGDGPNRQANWNFCSQCGSLFRNGADLGRCFREGGTHSPAGVNFALPYGLPEDSQNQANWRCCRKCRSLFWAPDGKGLCPAGDLHEGETDGLNYVLPHVDPNLKEDGNKQTNWRFCVNCCGMFFDGSPEKGTCPQDPSKGHVAMGVNFMLTHDVGEDPQHQGNWHICLKCLGMVYWRPGLGKGYCPKEINGNHEHDLTAGYTFVLAHDIPADSQNQGDWRFCGHCSGLFWSGDTERSRCPSPQSTDGHHLGQGLNFVLPHNPGVDAISQGSWRHCIRCHGMVYGGEQDIFSGVSPCVIRNAEHPGLPPTSAEWGLVMVGFGFVGDANSNYGFRVAWMPLTAEGPRLHDTLYYTGQGWSRDAASAKIVATRPRNTYTSVSAAWLEGPRRWILLYSDADDEAPPKTATWCGPVMARIGTSPWDWSDPIELFQPERDGAYGPGGFMHKNKAVDHFNPDIPPAQNPADKNPDHPGWAYGVFLLKKYTDQEWDAVHKVLRLYYLMSTSSPYHVHVMCSSLDFSASS